MKNTTTSVRIDWLSLVGLAAMLVLLVLHMTSRTPPWVYWTAFVLWCLRLVWMYFTPDSWRHRVHSWRMTDSRTTDGDQRGTSWAKGDR